MRIFEFSETVTQWIEVAAFALEVLAVAVIVVSIVYATGPLSILQNDSTIKENPL